VTELFKYLGTHYNYFATMILVVIGLYGMLAKGNLVKKLMGMNIFQVGVILFFVSLGMKTGATVPVARAHEHTSNAADYLNPLPHGLMLTAIVVGVSTTGVALALLIRIHARFKTLEERDLLRELEG
jgi:multicomponent Na+:H+ antiporter subunit C